MYLPHFGLREFPFNLTPDIDFAFHSRPYQEALNTLLLAIAAGDGFLKVTGEVGTGKTLLCRRLFERLDASMVTAYLPNPNLHPHDMLRALAAELGARVRSRDECDLFRSLQRKLLALAAQGKPVLICVDEAQALPTETLETLRLLSNLETGKRKLLQIVLFGQPELDVLLRRPAMRSLSSRITFATRLTPLGLSDVQAYLEHRLKVAGWQHGPLFSRTAGRLILLASAGVPRRINTIAHKTLLVAYGEGVQQVGARQAWRACRDANSTLGALLGLVHPRRTLRLEAS